VGDEDMSDLIYANACVDLKGSGTDLIEAARHIPNMIVVDDFSRCTTAFSHQVFS
jgi:hypothetical protein